ncbi:hypothetical protein HC231_07930 [Brenneria izadpanahii]|uniref:Uncharacterized protein n=1 Tax=Brenneria izadpanahii TaxID=2722756 RepID=A0ABX7URB2_9GAMM|nr:hypothetical protein [Brenneria izadpanahii]QTF07875.1 hypothetical protein HC231_07930 [Brenneria izadpanahii]
MINLELDINTGSISLDNAFLKDLTEDDFINSMTYKHLVNKKEIREITPHHYLINDVKWMGKNFEVTIRPKCFDNIPFMLYLVDKNGSYYSSLSNWNERANITMLDKEVLELSIWIMDKFSLYDSNKMDNNGKRWEFNWGRITVSYETKSFNCGIYITYINY